MKKLHFGCFVPIEGWVNTDISPHIFISRIPFGAHLIYKLGKMSEERYQQHKSNVFKQVQYMDITKKFPYANNTFNCAFSSHVLEHLYFNEAKYCLAEVHRVLIPGGVVRISVPDLDKCIQLYNPNNANEFSRAMYESTQKADKNRHHWMYNEQSMREMLESVGFSAVYRREFRVGICPDIEIIDNRPDSLFMEAIK